MSLDLHSFLDTFFPQRPTWRYTKNILFQRIIEDALLCSGCTITGAILANMIGASFSYKTIALMVVVAFICSSIATLLDALTIGPTQFSPSSEDEKNALEQEKQE